MSKASLQNLIDCSYLERFIQGRKDGGPFKNTEDAMRATEAHLITVLEPTLNRTAR